MDVVIDLGRISRNVSAIKRATGVAVLGVVKADAYGLGAREVAGAVRELVDGWCVFSLDEAIAAGLGGTGKPTLAIGPAEAERVAEYVGHNVRPGVCCAEDARALRAARGVLCVDTGMRRFACPAEEVERVIEAGGIDEAFTHAARLDQVERLVEMTGGRGLRLHAAGSALLGEPRAWLDAVRPGLAMYEGAMRVSGRLAEVREARGPVGYTGFTAGRIGVMVGGYSNGVRKGRCVVNGRMARLAEVGMQSSYVDLSEIEARAGDEVILLGEGVGAAEVAGDWGTSPQAVLVGLGLSGRRRYL